jgi:hypothetical protein
VVGSRIGETIGAWWAATVLAPHVVHELWRVDRSLRDNGYCTTRAYFDARTLRPLDTRLTATQLGRLVSTIGHAPVVGRSCLRRAFVLADLLARTGLRPDVRIGALRTDGAMTAHAWVEVDGEVVGERAGVDGFAVIRGLA